MNSTTSQLFYNVDLISFNYDILFNYFSSFFLCEMSECNRITKHIVSWNNRHFSVLTDSSLSSEVVGRVNKGLHIYIKWRDQRKVSEFHFVHSRIVYKQQCPSLVVDSRVLLLLNSLSIMASFCFGLWLMNRKSRPSIK